MDKYVDGFLLPLAADKVDAYREMAATAGRIWMEHGALQYQECIGDDMNIEGVLSFEHAADAAPGEKVVFAWITYESREHRDQVNAAVRGDPRMKPLMDAEAYPFDCARMAYGGFRSLVSY